MTDRERVLPGIAITGAATICALGLDRDQALDRIIAGDIGFSEGDGLEAAPEEHPLVGQAVDLPDPIGSSPDRAERYLRRTMLDAIEDGDWTGRLPERTSVVMGTTLGGIRHLGEGMRRNDFAAYRRLNNGAVSLNTLSGTGLPEGGISVSAACASGLTAIINGALLLQSGEADLVIAGGYDPISEFSLSGFMSLRLVAPDRPMPFEADRSGMKVAEGYGFVVLERTDEAVARGARILGHVTGSGERSDAYHLTQPQPDGVGAGRALELALAGGGGGLPDWILAHATSTPANDGAEHAGYRRTLGTGLEDVPVTALKSRLGHTLGAAGALELILGLTAMERGILATTADGETDREHFPELNVIRGTPPETQADRIAVMSLGFGGADASLVVDRRPPATPRRTRTKESIVFTGAGALLPGVGVVRGAACTDSRPAGGGIDASAFEGLDDPRATRRLAQISRLARAAGRIALEEAALPVELIAESDALVGSFHGASEYSLDYYREIIDSGIEMGNPLLFAESVPNIPSAQVSLGLGIQGATMTVAGTRTSAVEALHLARLRIENGLAERALVIAVEEDNPVIGEVMRDGGALRLADGADQVVGAGAIAVMIETESAARRRGASMLARLAGTGIEWANTSTVAGRIRTGRALVRRFERPHHRLMSTASRAPIGRIERAISGAGVDWTDGTCEMNALSPFIPLLRALGATTPTTLVACDFNGGHGVTAIDPC